MGASALADMLMDFGQTERRRSRATETRAAAPDSAAGINPEPPVRMDIDALLADERGKAEAEVTARLEERFQEILALEREVHAREIEEMLTAAGKEAAGRMLERLCGMEERLVALTSAATARILGSVVSDDVRQRGIEELARTIRQAASDDETIRIRVKSPQTLFAALAEHLGDWAVHLEHAESSGMDITVDINETVFETRFAEWSASLMEALS
ncbi:MAG TPA: hypothetical protein VHC00_10730 [Rhizobiaceae bacterium]|nr:hypothetical protein [Rhizobiaceae bacterium]